MSITQGILRHGLYGKIAGILQCGFRLWIFVIPLAVASLPSAANGASPIQFAPPININIPGYVGRLCAGDFNGDGSTDLAVENLYGVIRILTNNGSGQLGLWSTFNANGPLGAGDFNSDGRLDLVTGGAAATAWLNRGDGTFAGTNIASGYAYDPIAVADLNRDGKPDLLLLQGGAKAILSVFLGKGDGTFALTTNYTYMGGNQIAIADFDRNTNADLVIADDYSLDATVFLGNGDGTFAHRTDYSAAYYSQRLCVSVGDFDNNGSPDLLIGNFDSASLTMRLNNGNGTFGSPKLISLPIKPSALAAADLDGDKNLDIIAGNPLAIMQGFGDGTFGPPMTNFTSFVIYPTSNQSLVVADFDGDGRPDIATSSVSNNFVSILLNRTLPSISVSRISVQNADELLELKWPDVPGFNLEFTTNVSQPGSWNVVTNTPSIVNGQRTVVTSAFGTSGFYRLSK